VSPSPGKAARAPRVTPGLGEVLERDRQQDAKEVLHLEKLAIPVNLRFLKGGRRTHQLYKGSFLVDLDRMTFKECGHLSEFLRLKSVTTTPGTWFTSSLRRPKSRLR